MHALVSKARAVFLGGARAWPGEIGATQEISPVARMAVMAVYGAILILLASRHEFWRDEVRGLTYSMDNGFPEIFTGLRYEGHPALWLLILWIAFRLFHSVLVLPIASAVIAAGATYLFLARAPFRPWQKVLFAFGVFPLYEYSVICRDYGISMLLLFAACCLYKDRLVRPLRYGLVLALLANTNAHALMVTAGFLASILLDLALQLKERREGSGRLAASCALVAIGILVSLASAYPDKTVSYTSMVHLTVADLPSAVLTVLGSLGNVLWYPRPALACVAMGVIALLFYRDKQIMTMFVVATLGLSALVNLGHPGELRHRGVYIMFLMALFWIDRARTADGEQVLSPFERWKPAVLTTMLILQVALAVRPVWNDYKWPLSSAKAFGQLVRQNEALKDAIIIGEPDYYMEALPYYLPNDIYIPREERFGRRVQFTTASRQRFSLLELLQTGIRLKKQTGRAVLIALGHELRPDGPFVLGVSYASLFEYSREELEEFRARTVKLATFDRALGDENYTVYLVIG